MAFNNFKCNHLVPLHFKGLERAYTETPISLLTCWPPSRTTRSTVWRRAPPICLRHFRVNIPYTNISCLYGHAWHGCWCCSVFTVFNRESNFQSIRCVVYTLFSLLLNRPSWFYRSVWWTFLHRNDYNYGCSVFVNSCKTRQRDR